MSRDAPWIHLKGNLSLTLISHFVRVQLAAGAKSRMRFPKRTLRAEFIPSSSAVRDGLTQEIFRGALGIPIKRLELK